MPVAILFTFLCYRCTELSVKVVNELMADGERFYFFFFFGMLIFSGHVCILRAGYWHFMWMGKIYFVFMMISFKNRVFRWPLGNVPFMRLVNVIFQLVCSPTFCSFSPTLFFLMTLLTDFFIPFRGGKERSDQGPKISFWSKTICFILKRPTSIPPCPHLKQILLFVANSV